jgi:acyl-CoA thioester hydrolase
METTNFSKTYEVSWEELDPIGHLRGPVFIDYALNTQMSWIAQYGYTQDRFAKAGYYPIVMRLHARYYRELVLGESVTDTPQLSGLSPDGAMWKIVHHLSKADGEKVATITIEGTWFNWKKREAVVPERDLAEILTSYERAEDFKKLRPLSKSETANDS